VNITLNTEIHRRALIRNGLGVASGAALLQGQVRAEPAKITQSAARYQEAPKGKAQCDGCFSFMASAACKVVAGAISPMGCCMLYAAKP